MTFQRCVLCGKMEGELYLEEVYGGYRHPRGACPTVIDGFDGPEDGSQARYGKRRAGRPWTAHTFWWVVHNAVAHPLIAVLPIKPLFSFHDWSSRKMHGR
jgi:hypothetical protein